MVMALWLQSVTVVDRQATFTITSPRLSVCLPMTATDCGHRAITILLILVEDVIMHNFMFNKFY